MKEAGSRLSLVPRPPVLHSLPLVVSGRLVALLRPLGIGEAKVVGGELRCELVVIREEGTNPVPHHLMHL